MGVVVVEVEIAKFRAPASSQNMEASSIDGGKLGDDVEWPNGVGNAQYSSHNV